MITFYLQSKELINHCRHYGTLMVNVWKCLPVELQTWPHFQGTSWANRMQTGCQVGIKQLNSIWFYVINCHHMSILCPFQLCLGSWIPWIQFWASQAHYREDRDSWPIVEQSQGRPHQDLFLVQLICVQAFSTMTGILFFGFVICDSVICFSSLTKTQPQAKTARETFGRGW